MFYCFLVLLKVIHLPDKFSDNFLMNKTDAIVNTSFTNLFVIYIQNHYHYI